MRIALSIAATVLAGPALAQTATAPATAPTAAPTTAAAPAKPDVTVGAKVVDAQGGDVGMIESVTNGVATLSTGTHRAGIPITSFAQTDGKLVLGLTKAQVDAQGAPIASSPATTASASAAAGAPATAPATGASMATPAAIAVGAAVKDSTGAPVGTVKAVNGDMVTVASATASAQLPKKSFAQSGDALVIGLTAAQFETAAKAAGGANKG